MKKILLTAAALLVFGAAATAQFKVDSVALAKAIEKSDADIANPKKNTKSQTWLERANAFLAAAKAPSNQVYVGIPKGELPLVRGRDFEMANDRLDNVDYDVIKYPYIDIYFKGENAVFWREDEVIPNALELAYEAFDKAYTMDSKTMIKVRTGMEAIANLYKMRAHSYYSFKDFEKAAENYQKAYEVELHPVINIKDTACMFNTGYLYVFSKNYQKAIKPLELTLENGYYDNGNVYYYLGFSLLNLAMDKNVSKADSAAYMTESKKVLYDALKEFSSNTVVIEGLVNYYAVSGEDPSEIIEVVKQSVEADPQNSALWNGLGHIYTTLEQTDDAITAFAKVVELSPNDFAGNYFLGSSWITKANELNTVFNETIATTSAAAQEEAYNKIMDAYRNAVPCLEKAHEIMPEEPSTVELVKNVLFRLRDDSPETMAKYERYNTIWKKMQM